MNNTNLNVATFDMGANSTAYQTICLHNNIEFTEEGYEVAEDRTAAHFDRLDRMYKLDVVMLQGVYREERPLLAALTDKGFQLLGSRETKGEGDRKGCFIDRNVIFIRSERFKDILNCSQEINFHPTPIVIATDNLTNRRVMLVTADISQEKMGDYYIEAVIERMDELGKKNLLDIQLFGANMGVDPKELSQNQTKKKAWDHRFIKLEKAGFQNHQSGGPTELYVPSFGEQGKSREVDFIFSRQIKEPQSFWKKLFSKNEVIVKAEQLPVFANFELAADQLPTTSSDHLPVMTQFTIRGGAHPPLESDWEMVEDSEKK